MNNELIYTNRNLHWKESLFVIDLLLHILITTFIFLKWTNCLFIVIPIVIYFVIIWFYLYSKYFVEYKVCSNYIEIGGGIMNPKVETFQYEIFNKGVYRDSHRRWITLFGGVNINYIDLYTNNFITSSYIKNGMLRLYFF